MDFGATLSRAFRIMLDHKVLWILGFLAALGGGAGSSAQSPQFTNRFASSDFAPLTTDPNLIIAGASIFLCLLLILGVVLFVVGTIARGGLIAGVQQIETEGHTTFGHAWSVGASRFWRLFGLNVLLYLPLIIFVIIVAILFGGVIASFIVTTSSSRGDQNPGAAVGLLSGVIVLLCCLICVLVIYGLLAMAIQTFGERAIVLENLGVTESIRRGWNVFRNNLGNIILLALVMAVISFVIGLIVGAVVLAVFAPTLFPMFGELSRGGVISAARTVLAIVGILVAIVLSAIVNTLFITFNSTAWTLAYQSFTGATPAVPTSTVTPPPLPAA